MPTQLELGDVVVHVVRKSIKNMHLSVYPPTGRVRLAVPSHMDVNTIRAFAITKLPWIRRQRLRLAVQERQSPREYLGRESHYVWGQRYLLAIHERPGAPEVRLRHRTLALGIRPNASIAARHAAIEAWYRKELRAAVPELISRWEKALGVHVSRLFIQHMKTRWGSCNVEARSIRLNSELVKKPPECLEYIVVHELVHLIERTHNDRFLALMDKHLPQWRERRKTLNAAPLAHEEWGY